MCEEPGFKETFPSLFLYAGLHLLSQPSWCGTWQWHLMAKVETVLSHWLFPLETAPIHVHPTDICWSFPILMTPPLYPLPAARLQRSSTLLLPGEAATKG